MLAVNCANRFYPRIPVVQTGYTTSTKPSRGCSVTSMYTMYGYALDVTLIKLTHYLAKPNNFILKFTKGSSMIPLTVEGSFPWYRV